MEEKSYDDVLSEWLGGETYLNGLEKEEGVHGVNDQVASQTSEELERDGNVVCREE